MSRCGSQRQVRAGFCHLLGLVLVLMGGLSLLPAQSAKLQISGRVRDSAGAPVAGAVVRLQRPGGSPLLLHSDLHGRFHAAPLAPGAYVVTVSKSGFITQSARLRPGASARLRFVMVRAAAPGGAIQSQTVENTPLNGRDWTQLATLQPGVSGVSQGPQQQGSTAQHGFGAALSISGGRPEENDYLLDGVSISDYANGAPGSVVGAALGVDAVQKMTVLNSSYPASVGRTAGGVISASTRSGGRQWHGSLYEFLRNSALDARNFFDVGKIPPFRRNQFGASAGGALGGGAFLFGDYEGLRQSLGITNVDTVPTAAARLGHLSTGNVAVDPVVAQYLQTFFPLPNGPTLGSGDVGVYTFAGQQGINENYFTTRADLVHRRDTLSAIFMIDRSLQQQPDLFDNVISSVSSNREFLVLQDVHRWGIWVNNLRFGFSRATAVDGGVLAVLNPAVTNPTLSMIPGQNPGGINVSGLTGFQGGPNAQQPRLASSKSFAWNSFQGYDDVSWVHGPHAVQFGAMFERMQDNLGILSDTNGSFKFASLADFLQNRPLTFSGTVPRQNTEYGIRQTLFAAYAQDAYHAAPRLNLTAGLRYEIASVPSEIHNRIGNLRHLTDAAPQLGGQFFLNPTLHNFEPRVGLAWQPFAHAATIIHSGFAIFDVLPLPYMFPVIVPFSTPYFQQYVGSTLAPGSFPTGAYQQLAAAAGTTSLRTNYVEHHPHRSYVMQWNLMADQPLGGNASLSVGYVGARGVHLPFRQDDFNTVLPAQTAQGYLYPPTATSQRLNPAFSRINGIMWQADSYYNALEVAASARLRHGLQFQASYTWGKSMDTSSASVTADQYPNSLMNMPWFNTRLDRALSDFNVSHNFVANFTWQPAAPWARGGLATLFEHWRLGGVFKVQSGTPFTAEIAGDPLGTKLSDVREVPDLVPGCRALTTGNPNGDINLKCFAFPSPANRMGRLGRNTLIGPGLWNLDFSMIKDTPVTWISTESRLQFRAEFFNVFNHPDFAPPLSHLEILDPAGNPVPGAGLITATSQPAREIQLALKLLF